MPEPTNSQTPDTNGTESSPKTEELLNQIGELNSQVKLLREASADANAIASDPDVLEVVRRKKSGKEFRITDPEPPFDPLADLLKYESQEPDDEDRGDPENLRLLQHLGDKMSKAIEGAISKATAPLQEKIQELEGTAQSFREERAQEAQIRSISATMDKYPDFDTYKEDIVKIWDDMMKSGPTPEQLYQLAKISKVGFPNPGASSELPFNFPEGGRPRSAPKDVRHGIRGMQDMIRDAVKRRQSSY